MDGQYVCLVEFGCTFPPKNCWRGSARDSKLTKSASPQSRGIELNKIKIEIHKDIKRKKERENKGGESMGERRGG